MVVALTTIGCEKQRTLPSSDDNGDGSRQEDRQEVELELPESVTLKQDGLGKLTLKMPEADRGEERVLVRLNGLPRRVRVTNAALIGRGSNERVVLKPAAVRRGTTIDVAAGRRARPGEETIEVVAECGNQIGRGRFRLVVAESIARSWPTGFTGASMYDASPQTVLGEATEYLKGKRYKLRKRDERGGKTTFYLLSSDDQRIRVETEPKDSGTWFSVTSDQTDSARRRVKTIIHDMDARIKSAARTGDGDDSPETDEKTEKPGKPKRNADERDKDVLAKRGPISLSRAVTIRQGETGKLTFRMRTADGDRGRVTLRFVGLPASVQPINVQLKGEGRDRRILVSAFHARHGTVLELQASDDAPAVTNRAVKLEARCGRETRTVTFRLTVAGNEQPEDRAS